jgi:hypothetical protein
MDMTHITKISTGNKVTYQYYKGDRVYRFTEKDNLPMTMVEILVNGECYETRYTETGKLEMFR